MGKIEPKWYNVNEDARVWAGHSNSHKQGWIYAPAAILAIEEYKRAVRFVEFKVEGKGRADFAASPDYQELWVRLMDLSLEPYEGPNGEPDETPDPDTNPDTVSDAELGAAFRTLVNFVLNRVRG